ncbi:MAG: 2-hydroxyacyl-CoA dehydratase [Deltaproteobacteria bacterium]|nr:2-hydroxyacyl-CoA dehydratase [Deltaproteobacteria bacterium]
MDRFLPPSRKIYIGRQKEVYDRRIFGVFPAHYPREIFWAMNALPVEIWDPPLEMRYANTHLQPYICSIVKSGLELIVQGKGEDLDGFVFPHTCDSIQNMASIVNDYLGIKKPCYFFYHPKAPYGEASQEYYREQLHRFISDLERRLGSLNITALHHAIEKGRALLSLLRELYIIRARGNLDVSNQAFYRLIRQVEYRHPDDFIPFLKEYLEVNQGEKENGPVVVLSGVLPNPVEILSILDQVHIRIGDDDFLCCGRRLTFAEVDEDDPFEALTKQYFSMPPCTTKNSPISERLDYIMAKINRCGAKGVIFSMLRFCEPELFDLPILLDSLKKNNIATLVIDTEINQGISGQLKTRIEAFAELIR